MAGINDAFIPGLLAADNAAPVAIASRRPEIAGHEADRWGILRSHPTYEALLEDPEVEAVYIPLPNHLHAEWTVRALDAGKHVLCEKPIAMTLPDVDRMEVASRRAGRLVMEAFMYRYAPRWRRAKELLAEGLIGTPQLVRVGFAFKQFPTDYNIRFDPAVGGGILWDMGCYAVNMSRLLFEAEPDSVIAMASRRAGAEVDTTIEALMRFPGSRAAVTNVSFDYGNPYSQVEVIGSNGWLAMPGTGMRREPFTKLTFHDSGDSDVFGDGSVPRELVFPFADPYQLEIEHFSDCILNGAEPAYGLADARHNTRALVAIDRAIASRGAVDLATVN